VKPGPVPSPLVARAVKVEDGVVLVQTLAPWLADAEAATAATPT
jgi:hypothetical protein